MTDVVAEAFDRLLFKEEALHSTFYVHGNRGSNPVVRAQYKALTDARRELSGAAIAAAARIRTLKNDDTMFPAGRFRLVEEARAKAAKTMKDAESRAWYALQIIEAELFNTAMPKLARDREMPARDEARMLLDASADPVAAMVELARRGGEMGALCTSSWAESYLRARATPLPLVKEGVQAVRLAAFQGAAQSADPAIQEAAVAYNVAQANLHGAIACTRSIAHHELESALEAPVAEADSDL